MKTAKQHNASARFTFTAKAPREGNRTPMNKIKYSEERDAETGYGYFSARYYDPDLSAVWLSVDPLTDKYPGISPYAYCAWNPVKLVDPDGRDLADYYDVNGQYLGTDGINDGRIFVITDNDEINRIIDNGADCSIQFTDANSLKSKYELLPQELREKIINDLERDYSNQNNREHGGVAVQQGDGTIQLGHYSPGPEYQENQHGSISTEICATDKWILDDCINPAMTRYHCHGIGLLQVPSDDDYNNYSNSPTQYGYAMQMGMVSKTVIFYNDSQKKPLFSMSFENFKNIGR